VPILFTQVDTNIYPATGITDIAYTPATGFFQNITPNTIVILVSGQVVTDNLIFDLNFRQPEIFIQQDSTTILSSSAISFQGSSFSTTIILPPNSQFQVQYQHYFYGTNNASETLNILAGLTSTRVTLTQLSSVRGPTGPSLVGLDSNTTPYTQSGFATPFINIGPSIAVPGAVGGWRVGPTGTMRSNDYTLIAQQNTPYGLTGPIFNLLTPTLTLLPVNNAISGYTFKPVDRGSTFLLTSTSNSAPFGLSQGFLAAQDIGFYVTLKNANQIANNYTIIMYYSGSTIPSTGTAGNLTGSALLYWTGSSFTMYI
jgi:hypothetical protein